jgi:membrane-associated protease RseP (regulator of RpoE activity)
MSEAREPETSEETEAEPRASHGLRAWALPLLLMALTLLTTLWAGAGMHGVDVASPADLWAGWDFALPLMGILVAHEMGHYVAGRIHGVDISPPFFIPMPFALLGTMGAVIRMRGTIRDNDALLDVGAAGPLAGIVVALPVLVFGIVTSPIEALPAAGGNFILEGHSLLYAGLLFALKGPIPAGMDIMLSPTALAGWAGLLVTMMNLLPVGQLDGGHVAYALLGRRQNVVARRVLMALPIVALLTGLYYAGLAAIAGARDWALVSELGAGVHWLVWFGVLQIMARLTGLDHPEAGDRPLSPGRRVVAIGTLVLFVLLFMPSWVRNG